MASRGSEVEYTVLTFCTMIGGPQFRNESCLQDMYVNMNEPLKVAKKLVRQMLCDIHGGCPDYIPKDQRWNAEELELVFDEMLVEEEATPAGLGMLEGDKIGLLSRVKPGGSQQQLVTFFAESKRLANLISIGLNVIVGEEEGGLPVSRQSQHAPLCEEQLRYLRTVTVPAFR